jgi:uncharacterized protein
VRVVDQDIEAVRRIVVDRLRDTGARVLLFGSAARGEMRRTSDIDVSVLPERPLPTGLLSEVRDALHDSSILREVDLVDLSDTNESFRAQVLQEGVPWTE